MWIYQAWLQKPEPLKKNMKIDPSGDSTLPETFKSVTTMSRQRVAFCRGRTGTIEYCVAATIASQGPAGAAAELFAALQEHHGHESARAALSGARRHHKVLRLRYKSIAAMS